MEKAKWRATWRKNLYRNTLELFFSERPPEDILSQIRALGFLYSFRKELWYGYGRPHQIRWLEKNAVYTGTYGRPLSEAEKVTVRKKAAKIRLSALISKYKESVMRYKQHAEYLRCRKQLCPTDPRIPQYTNALYKQEAKIERMRERIEFYRHFDEIVYGWKHTWLVLDRLTRILRKRKLSPEEKKYYTEAVEFWKSEQDRIQKERKIKLLSAADFKIGQKIEVGPTLYSIDKINNKSLIVHPISNEEKHIRLFIWKLNAEIDKVKIWSD